MMGRGDRISRSSATLEYLCTTSLLHPVHSELPDKNEYYKTESLHSAVQEFSLI